MSSLSILYCYFLLFSYYISLSICYSKSSYYMSIIIMPNLIEVYYFFTTGFLPLAVVMFCFFFAAGFMFFTNIPSCLLFQLMYIRVLLLLPLSLNLIYESIKLNTVFYKIYKLKQYQSCRFIN